MPELTKPSIPIHRLRAIVAGTSLSIGQVFDEMVPFVKDEALREALIAHKVKFDDALIHLDGVLESLPECKD